MKSINSIMNNRLNKEKYWPVIISTSRGMGKMFLLRKFGMQQIKDNLKTPVIGNAELVPNLDVKDLYTSYDMLCSWENYNLGVGYETLFASSLAQQELMVDI